MGQASEQIINDKMIENKINIKSLTINLVAQASDQIINDNKILCAMQVSR